MFEWVKKALDGVAKAFGGRKRATAPCPRDTASITVAVSRGDTRVPVDGARVSISGASGGSKLSAKDSGLALFDGLPAGAYHVDVSTGGTIVDGFRVDAFVQDLALAAGEARHVPVELFPTRFLDLVTIDDHFAPSVEICDMTYDIFGLSGDVVLLRILDWQGSTIFERELTAGEKADGSGKPLSWDGKMNLGSNKGRWATPLMSPFEAHLLHSAQLQDKEPFRVMYHSIDLGWAPHTSDEAPPPESERTRFIQYRLNELGYDPGPVDGVAGAMTTGAVRRFQRANYEVGTQKLLAEDGVVGPLTFAALKGAAARRRARWEAGKNPLTEDAKFFVEDNYFNDRGEDFVTTTLPEFDSLNRKTHVEDKLGRPHIPLEASIKLLGKADNAVDAPAAVGPAQIAWEVDDAPEDVSVVTGVAARNYVDRARQFGTGAAAAAARIDGDGDNLLATLEGLRDEAAANYVKVWYPPSGARIEPHVIDRYTTQTRAGKTFHQAIVKAWEKSDTHARRQGKAGLYLRFSNKGGDDGKVRASLVFEGHPNRAKLEADHKPREAGLAKETGRWTVWRRMRISAYCKQTVPTRAPADVDWGWFRDRWKEAFVEVENNGNPLQIIDYATVVPEATYKATLMALPVSHRPAGITNAASLTYRANAIYGGPPVRAQSVGEAPQDYVANVVDAGVTPWIQHPLNAILGLIHAEVRKTSPEGLIVFDFAIYHQEVIAREIDPATGAVTAVEHSRTWPSTNGYVRLDGAVTMNVHNPFDVSCYSLHETGHGRFLYHHITNGVGPTENVDHHDEDQERCAMSYAIGADTPQMWTYGFCGKCILRLRGADVILLPPRYLP